MLLMASSLGSGRLKMWKCLINLGVKGLLPPPGGAAAHNTLYFSITFQKNAGRS